MHGIFRNGIYTKKEDEKQILRMGGGSWTINLDDLPADVQVVEYITPVTTYCIRLEDAKKFGWIRLFAGERKLVVPLKYWQKEVLVIDG